MIDSVRLGGRSQPVHKAGSYTELVDDFVFVPTKKGEPGVTPVKVANYGSNWFCHLVALSQDRSNVLQLFGSTGLDKLDTLSDDDDVEQGAWPEVSSATLLMSQLMALDAIATSTGSPTAPYPDAVEVVTINRTGTLIAPSHPDNQCKTVGHESYSYEARVRCSAKLDAQGFVIDHEQVHEAATKAFADHFGSCEQVALAMCRGIAAACDAHGSELIRVEVDLRPIGPDVAAYMKAELEIAPKAVVEPTGVTVTGDEDEVLKMGEAAAFAGWGPRQAARSLIRHASSGMGIDEYNRILAIAFGTEQT